MKPEDAIYLTAIRGIIRFFKCVPINLYISFTGSSFWVAMVVVEGREDIKFTFTYGLFHVYIIRSRFTDY